MLSVAQLALSLTLLVGAGLFVRSLIALTGRAEGGVRERIVMVRVEPRGSDQRNIPGASERLDRIYQELIRRARQIPGVLSATMANGTPTIPTSSAAVQVSLPGGDPVRVPSLMAYPDYFATIGIALVAGREFQSSDLVENAPPVCIVNQSFVRQFLGGGEAVGKPCYSGVRARLLTSAPNPVPMPRELFTIVGVVEDSRYSNPMGETRPLVYQTFLQANTGRGQMVLHLRVDGAVNDVVQRVRHEVAAIDPAMPMFDVHTLEEEMQAALVQQRLLAMLASLFGALALLLSSVGLYGLFAFTVVQRRAEIGLRVAVGARRTQVTWLVVGDALRLIMLGVMIGVPLAFAAGKLLSNRLSGLLFGFEPTDPTTIAGASVVLAMVAVTAVVLPARHATKVDPLTVLRT
jgi:predicted permease